MTTHVHKLAGCAPTPLAHYLKALAVLRLVSEQRDPTVRGWWKEEAFWLATKLSREELESFFLDEYAPTPILSPWNGGSGFYFQEGKEKEKDEATGKRKKTGVRDVETAATRAIGSLLESNSPRLRDYRQCAEVAKEIVTRMSLIEAPDTDGKVELIAALRSSLPLTGIRWLDAAVASADEKFFCAPLAGSGGNDGNEDFSKNFLERALLLATVQHQDDVRPLLQSCLFGGAVAGATDFVAGQFFPGGNGGTNAGAGFSGKAIASTWEYVLAVEGVLLFAGTAARRLDSATAGAAFPFAVRLDAAGYASAAGADRDASRSEVWLPLWTRPTALEEVRSLLSEGRLRIDGSDAQRTTDVVRAVGSLGTSRGVESFERTAFFTRNGNMHYSAPVGRWTVSMQSYQELLDDVDPWIRELRELAREDKAPRNVTSALRNIDEAILAVCRTGSAPVLWQALLVALSRAESALLGSPSKTKKRNLSPLPTLRSAWIGAADDGSTELRLALALASQDVALGRGEKPAFSNIRAHWMPIERSQAGQHAHQRRYPARFATDATGLAKDPDVVCAGTNLERDCIALLRRRLQIAPGLNARGLGLFGARGAEASLADVMRFLAGQVDDGWILSLARAFMAIEWWSNELPWLQQPDHETPDAAYAIARVAHLSEPLDIGEKVFVALDPEAIARLVAGNFSGAMDICLRRFRASGLLPLVRAVVGNRRQARRLAASLAFPIRGADAARCARLIMKPHEPEDSVHVR